MKGRRRIGGLGCEGLGEKMKLDDGEMVEELWVKCTGTEKDEECRRGRNDRLRVRRKLFNAFRL